MMSFSSEKKCYLTLSEWSLKINVQPKLFCQTRKMKRGIPVLYNVQTIRTQSMQKSMPSTLALQGSTTLVFVSTSARSIRTIPVQSAHLNPL